MVAGIYQKTWYVYTLSSPDGQVFYVGKGTGDRVEQHEREARTSICACRKCKKIRQIWNADGKVQKSIIYETITERDALVFEWAGINMIYAGLHLANTTGNRFYWEEHKKQGDEQMRRVYREREAKQKSKEERTYTLSEEAYAALTNASQLAGVSSQQFLEDLLSSIRS